MLEIGSKVKVTCKDNSIYIGTLAHICLGMDKENPTRVSVILLEDESNNMTYGNVHIWYSEIKDIEYIHEDEMMKLNKLKPGKKFPPGISIEPKDNECKCMNEDWLNSISNLSCKTSDIAWKSFLVSVVAIVISVTSLIVAFA